MHARFPSSAFAPIAAALPLLASGAAAAQTADVVADAPAAIRNLRDHFSVGAVAHGAVGSFESPRVWLDGTDVTSLVYAEIVDETSTDVDGNGVLDELSATVEVHLLDLAIEPGQMIEVDVSVPTVAGELFFRTATRVAAHVEVSLCDTLTFSSDPISACVEWNEVELESSAVRVLINGFDITPYVGLSGPDTLWDDTTGDFTQSRMDCYEFDLSFLAGYGLEGSTVTVEATGSTADGSTSSSASAASVAPGGLTDCHKTALKKFLDALGTNRNGGETSTTGDGTALRNAANQLQADLALCDPPFPSGQQSYTYTDADGDSVSVLVTVSGAGDATASGSADVVVAVGGDGNGSGNGGDASATNNRPGGAAIAAGGDGGSAATSGGNGGNGTARGNSGPNGTPSGTAMGSGGQGGSATNGTGRGGNGGNASANVPPTSVGNGGTRGGNGSAGTGAWGVVRNGGGATGRH
jgi:hypothetical protein